MAIVLLSHHQFQPQLLELYLGAKKLNKSKKLGKFQENNLSIQFQDAIIKLIGSNHSLTNIKGLIPKYEILIILCRKMV